jgi:hypothetical protein
MNAKSLRDPLLSSGQSMLSNTLGNQAPDTPGSANFGQGMLAGGVLELLLGDKRVRKFGGKARAYRGARRAGVSRLQQLAAAEIRKRVQPLRPRPKPHCSLRRRPPRITAARC